MDNEIKKIPFEGGELLGVRTEDGKVYLGIKKACLDIGLSEDQARNEIRKIQNNLLFESNCAKFDTVQIEGKREIKREVIGILESFVPMWLAQINLTPSMKKTNPQAVKKLLIYQLKAADALHEAFMATEEQRQEFYNELGLHGQIVELKEKITNFEMQLTTVKEDFNKVLDFSTINSRQAQKLLHAVKDRVGGLLGGARSAKYKQESRIYFKNLWNQFAARFAVTTYKDLNPIHMKEAYSFIENWQYSPVSK